MADASTHTLTRESPGYPTQLVHRTGAPGTLRVRGELGLPSRPRVAIVGTRRPDPYGLEMAHRLAGGLAAAGISVVSGGADGIDAAAHRAALERRGHTVAVFGCGLDVLYPAHHEKLFQEILDGGGALVSEHPDDALRPTQYTFPKRNRVVAGMSDAVVVVRAPGRSGALNTAAWARKLGVPLFAVPGNVGNPLSAGTLALLRWGARVATSAEDVLTVLGIQPSLPLEPRGAEDTAHPMLAGETARMLGVLDRHPRHAGDLARASRLGPGPALAALLQLELLGLCEQRPGQYFLRRAGAGKGSL
jgi:DNA processing protein